MSNKEWLAGGAALDLVLACRAGVVVQDLEGRVVDHNDSAERVLQMTHDQLLGRASLDPTWAAVDADLQPLSGEEHPAMRVLATGEPVVGFVMGVRAGSGDYRWLRVDSHPLTDRASGLSGAVTQFDDVTEELAAAEKLTSAIDRLQRHVVPTDSISIPGLEVHVRYRNVTEGLRIGGDFCDVYPAGSNRWGFFIGDAAGHDLNTIATTMVAHHTLRAAGQHLARPQRVLKWLDDTLLSTPDTVFCSAISGTIDFDSNGEPTIELANAGHPRPIHITPTGAASLEAASGICGVGAFEEPPLVSVGLQRGDQLVVYTDGLIESLTPRLDDDQLLSALHAIGNTGAAIDVIDEMIARSDRSQPSRRDDTAVIVIKAV